MHICFNIQNCCLQNINFLICRKPRSGYKVKSIKCQICFKLQSWVGRHLVINFWQFRSGVAKIIYPFKHWWVIWFYKALWCSQAVWESDRPASPLLFTTWHLLPPRSLHAMSPCHHQVFWRSPAQLFGPVVSALQSCEH